MSLTKFINPCGKNVPGNDHLLFLVKGADITSVTEVADEISAVTMVSTKKFIRVEADIKSVQYTAEGTFKTTGGETQNLAFKFSKPTKATEAFLNTLKDGVACGLVAIYVDGNRIPKAFGISGVAKEGKANMIHELSTNYDSGLIASDEGTQAYTITLTRLGYFGPIPFDTANTGTILGGTAAFIDWT